MSSLTLSQCAQFFSDSSPKQPNDIAIYEKALTAMLDQPGCASEIIRLIGELASHTVHEPGDAGILTFFSILLKKIIKEHWDKGKVVFREPELTEQEKAFVRDNAFILLRISIPSVQNTISSCISSIMKQDWPQAWREGMQKILSIVPEQGSLLCLETICEDLGIDLCGLPEARSECEAIFKLAHGLIIGHEQKIKNDVIIQSIQEIARTSVAIIKLQDLNIYNEDEMDAYDEDEFNISLNLSVRGLARELLHKFIQLGYEEEQRKEQIRKNKERKEKEKMGIYQGDEIIPHVFIQFLQSQMGQSQAVEKKIEDIVLDFIIQSFQQSVQSGDAILQEATISAANVLFIERNVALINQEEEYDEEEELENELAQQIMYGTSGKKNNRSKVKKSQNQINKTQQSGIEMNQEERRRQADQIECAEAKGLIQQFCNIQSSPALQYFQQLQSTPVTPDQQTPPLSQLIHHSLLLSSQITTSAKLCKRFDGELINWMIEQQMFSVIKINAIRSLTYLCARGKLGDINNVRQVFLLQKQGQQLPNLKNEDIRRGILMSNTGRIVSALCSIDINTIEKEEQEALGETIGWFCDIERGEQTFQLIHTVAPFLLRIWKKNRTNVNALFLIPDFFSQLARCEYPGSLLLIQKTLFDPLVNKLEKLLKKKILEGAQKEEARKQVEQVENQAVQMENQVQTLQLQYQQQQQTEGDDVDEGEMAGYFSAAVEIFQNIFIPEQISQLNDGQVTEGQNQIDRLMNMKGILAVQRALVFIRMQSDNFLDAQQHSQIPQTGSGVWDCTRGANNNIVEQGNNVTEALEPVQSLVSLLITMLGKDRDPEEVVPCGQYARAIFRRLTPQLQEKKLELQLMSVLVERMIQTKSNNLAVSLCQSVFLDLVWTNTAQFINMLKQTPPIADDSLIYPTTPTSLLQQFLSKWCELQADIRGSFQIKQAAAASQKLCMMWDADVNNLPVKGDIILEPETETGISVRTRSMTKARPDQYTVIPFINKVIKQTIALYFEEVESRKKLGEEEDDEDDDEEDGIGKDNDNTKESDEDDDEEDDTDDYIKQLHGDDNPNIHYRDLENEDDSGPEYNQLRQITTMQLCEVFVKELYQRIGNDIGKLSFLPVEQKRFLIILEKAQATQSTQS
ncbi:MAG: hypothetical protein EZS28_012334 [Streblomastix strix]|uniref:Importin N-terminal domain-containing protein n=1 Tax=Streblomastix strix TaxID=222440 RepID=A0A5J4WCN0_9EUKA|nr:MAG: hypothetical protein EZS28_012334 [Streblomastix strix]